MRKFKTILIACVVALSFSIATPVFAADDNADAKKEKKAKAKKKKGDAAAKKDGAAKKAEVSGKLTAAKKEGMYSLTDADGIRKSHVIHRVLPIFQFPEQYHLFCLLVTTRG